MRARARARAAAGAVAAWCVVAAAAAAAAAVSESFEEEAAFRRVRDASPRGGARGWEDLVTHVQFTVRWEQASAAGPAFAWEHFNLFPMQFGQTMDRFDVEELEMTFSKGRWRQRWGASPVPAAQGVEVWALLRAQDAPSADEAWRALAAALAGLSCASLDTIVDSRIARPRHTFGMPPLNTSETVTDETLFLQYGQLSSEASCTENLAPLLKLLPCRGNAGLAQVLVPTEIFRADHHAIRLHFRRVCDSRRGWSATCKTPGVELVLSVVLAHGRLAPAHAELATLAPMRTAVEECPLAAASRVFVEESFSNATTEMTCTPFLGPHATRMRELALRDLTPHDAVTKPVIPPQPLVRVTERFASGVGRTEGGVVTRLSTSSDFVDPIRLQYFEMVPAYLRVRPSSVRLEVNGVQVPAQDLWGPGAASVISLSSFYGSPTQLELTFDVAPGSSVLVSYAFEQAFLPLWDFPPDPNRGFDIPAAVASYSIPHQPGLCVQGVVADDLPLASPLLGRGTHGPVAGRRMREYAAPLLVSMPLPDFSMPYNVITLSSTVFAYLVGTTISILLQEVRVRPDPDEASQETWKRRKRMLKNLFFVALVGLAWMYENDRDTLQELLHHVAIPI
ncbi:GPI transamidase component PIG-T [Hondaea fermentalgiana]|uniref:GPI transamidase component PIG-T n=1 Tax=Hondaea fermentalgiana TaxID=2315210 RepID=A0A2R5GHI3_9STRA|nr:GPI transamidase component PIG-T [Hondaea fermentalgiana]|eukprot:GBG28103.1 GPI transamidase component PIG-T [Hondaea fermentalgiana]